MIFRHYSSILIASISWHYKVGLNKTIITINCRSHCVNNPKSKKWNIRGPKRTAEKALILQVKTLTAKQEQRDRKRSRRELWWLGGGLAVITSFAGRLFHWEGQIRRDCLKRFSTDRYRRQSEQGRAREAEREKEGEILSCCSAVLTWTIKSLLILIPRAWLTLASFAWGFCLWAWLSSLPCSLDPDAFFRRHLAPTQAD